MKSPLKATLQAPEHRALNRGCGIASLDLADNLGKREGDVSAVDWLLRGRDQTYLC